MPRADDLPSFKVGTTMTPCPSNPLGIKGCGEAGAIAAPAGGHQRHHRRDRHTRTSPCRRRPQAVWRRCRRSEQRECARGRATRLPAIVTVPEIDQTPCTAASNHVRIHLSRPSRCGRRRALLAKHEDAKLLAGGHTLIPTMKQRLAVARRARRSRQGRGPDRHRAEGPLARHRRDDARMPRSPPRAVVQEAIPALAELAGLIGDPAVRHRGTIGGSVANNDPTADYPAACSGARRHHRHQQAQDRGRRFLQGPVRDRARGRTRSSPRCTFPIAEQGGLREVPQPGLALCAGRRVRVEARLRRPRRRDRRRLERRVPRDRVRGGAEEALLRRSRSTA